MPCRLQADTFDRCHRNDAYLVFDVLGTEPGRNRQQREAIDPVAAAVLVD
jgi:hypothetical protein